VVVSFKTQINFTRLLLVPGQL